MNMLKKECDETLKEFSELLENLEKEKHELQAKGK